MSPIHIDLSLKEVLYSRSRKLTKWRLVSSPQQVASAQRGEITHRQPAIYTGQRSGCVWSRLNSVFWFLCQAPTAAQVLGASGKSRWPQEARREGGQPLWRCCLPTRGKALRRKAWFPQSSSASDSDCSSKPPTNSRGVRQAWGAQGRTAEQVPFSAATTAPASRGHPVPRGALVTLGGCLLCGAPGQQELQVSTLAFVPGPWSRPEPGLSRAGNWTKVSESSPPGQGWERAAQASAPSPAADAPLSPGIP